MSDPFLDTYSLAPLRRKAKRLRKQYEAGEAEALAAVSALFPNPPEFLKHADALHVIAHQHQFDSWPKLKFAAERRGLDRLSKQRVLRDALFHGQHWKVTALLEEQPDLASDDLALQLALFDVEAVRQALMEDAKRATEPLFGRRPIVHLAFSKHLQSAPEKQAAMIDLAELLRHHGADVNDFLPQGAGSEHSLSVLYGAMGHGNNMPLAAWLLAQGADPDDGESLYHATELGHHQGLDLLIAHGVDPRGTNALLRAMDFHDVDAVRKLLEAGAVPDDYNGATVGGEAPFVLPALHQAARRMSTRPMIDLLLDHGADPALLHDGVTAYSYGRVLGNKDLVEAIEARGLAIKLSDQERLLARIAEGEDVPETYVDTAQLPEIYRLLARELLCLSDRLDHIRSLVSVGIEYDRPDAQGLTPVQVAGWEGLVDEMKYFLKLGPDLSHVNGYGGTLLSTIVHGSEFCPERSSRDHIACAQLALHQGVALPKSLLREAGDETMAAFLEQWAADKPGQVI